MLLQIDRWKSQRSSAKKSWIIQNKFSTSYRAHRSLPLLPYLQRLPRQRRVSRAEPMLSCWLDLLFLFCLLLFYIFLPSMGWLCGVGVFGLIEYPYSLPALNSGLQNNNNNNTVVNK